MRQIKIEQGITNRGNQALDAYLREIGKIDLLTPEEEVQLAKKIKEGDQGALDKLVRANLRFVVSVAKQYQNQGLSLSDLINEGNIGLIKAARCFDETRGIKFISYAVWWIRQSIMSSLNEDGRTVRLPLNKVAQLSKLYKTIEMLTQKLEREPTDEELADVLHIKVGNVDSLNKARGATRPVSLDAPVLKDDSDRDNLLSFQVSQDPLPDANLDQESVAQTIKAVLSGVLTEREKEIIVLSFGIGGGRQMTSEEIGERIGISGERARQIKERAMSKLRKDKKATILRDILS